ncbi:mannitol dehydrogenase family protein [Jannaschia donghaensis]|uniref:Mannitol 2-dehydrogenase n=1 Tax=Jannaschia donghaensis TaxID=420998 RepID=A0A0M6YH48_9RHOB|nr:mannitol dehydrogenase family protein [Jannaschia donghaensis]CTQ49244.1 Mannitol 2-dehydrogenase [Jannaschia donghaensis]
MGAGLPGSPRLTRSRPPPGHGIVHLGPGAFFRAFNAVYTDDAMAEAGGDWGIIAVSLRSSTARDQLGPQGGCYTSVTLATGGDTHRIISAVRDVLVAPDDPAAVVAIMADPATRIVSLTITEKGYCHDPATGRLNRDHPDIQHDLSNPDAPRSAVGFIVTALARRRDAGQPAFTVLSCDNLPSNGAVARAVVLDFAQAYDADLADWIAANVTFPATMVDRITPATTDADVARLAQTAGYFDPGCVVHEAFRQWVVEDDFIAGRPAWDQAGAQMVRDVAAHETMKLRCLNGTHSALAYLGYLAGFETIADAVADPDFAALCRKLWQDEILPTVPPPEGEDLHAYCDTLMERYCDRAIRHRTWQIAMDGSQKLPQRLLGTIRDAMDAGHVPAGLCLAVAAWMRYVGGVDEDGKAIDVRDPHAKTLRAASDGADTTEGRVDALLGMTSIFDRDLARNAAFRAAILQAYATLERAGARAAVKDYVSG